MAAISRRTGKKSQRWLLALTAIIFCPVIDLRPGADLAAATSTAERAAVLAPRAVRYSGCSRVQSPSEAPRGSIMLSPLEMGAPLLMTLLLCNLCCSGYCQDDVRYHGNRQTDPSAEGRFLELDLQVQMIIRCVLNCMERGLICPYVHASCFIALQFQFNFVCPI